MKFKYFNRFFILFLIEFFFDKVNIKINLENLYICFVKIKYKHETKNN